MYPIISVQASNSGIGLITREPGQERSVAACARGISTINGEGDFYGDIARCAFLVCSLYNQVGTSEASQLVCGNARCVSAGKQCPEIILGEGLCPLKTHVLGNDGCLADSGISSVGSFERTEIILNGLHPDFEYADIFFEYDADILFECDGHPP